MSDSLYQPFGAQEHGYTSDNAYVDFAAQLWQQDGLSSDADGKTLYDDGLALPQIPGETAALDYLATPSPAKLPAPLPEDSPSEGKSIYHQAEVLVSQPAREWNQEFQAALDLPHGTHAERVRRLQVLNELSNDMTQAAEVLCTRIVLDMSLPNDSKLIKSVDVGGIAGGEKFIAANLFVKFASKDVSGLYGSDAAACAAAAHELKGARAYVGLDLPDIRPPLLCMVDVYGMRLLVSSVLPIGADTLVYGSADAGKTVHCDARADAVMRQAGQMLNLAPHVVGRTPEVQQELTGPCDIEVHRGKDGRTYVLDTARVFPPDATVLAQSRDVAAMVMPPHPASGMLPTLVASTEWQSVCAQQLAVLHSVDIMAVCAAGVQAASFAPATAAVLLHTIYLAGVPAYCLSLNPEHPAVQARAGPTDTSQRAWASWLRRKFSHGLGSTQGAAGAGADDDVAEAPTGLWRSSGQGRGDDANSNPLQDVHGPGIDDDGAYDVFTGVKFDSVSAPGFESVASFPRNAASNTDAAADAVQDELSVPCGLMINHRMSSMLGRQVYGTVMVLMPQRGAHLHKMLRQELVRKFETPLSSDAFTGFGMHGADHWNGAAAHAARYLQHTVIPQLAHTICFREVPIETSSQLERAMHEAGVNMRYLPQLLAHIKPSLYSVQVHIISAMVVRYCKQTLRMKLRSKVYEMAQQRTQLTWSQREIMLKDVVAGFFNCVFGLSEAADVFWGCDLPLGLRSKYGDVSAQFSYHSSLFSPEARIAYHKTSKTAREAMESAVSLLDRAEDPSLSQLQRTSLLMEHYRRMLMGFTTTGQLIPVDFRRLRAFILPHILLQEVCCACDVVLRKEVFEFFSASPASFWKEKPFSHQDIDSVKSSSTALMDMKMFVSMPVNAVDSDAFPSKAEPSSAVPAPPVSAPTVSASHSSMLTQASMLTLETSADAAAIFGPHSLQFAVARMAEAQDALDDGHVHDAKKISSEAWTYLLPVLSSAYAAVAASVHTGSSLSTGAFRFLQQREQSHVGGHSAALDSGLPADVQMQVARALGHLPSLTDASVSCLSLLSRIDEALEQYHTAEGYLHAAIALLQARYGNSDIMCPVAMDDFDRVVKRQAAGLDESTRSTLRYSVRYITIPRGALFTTALVESLLRLQIKAKVDELKIDDVQISMLYNTIICHMEQPPHDARIMQQALGSPFPLVLQFVEQYRLKGRATIAGLTYHEREYGEITPELQCALEECLTATHGPDSTGFLEKQLGQETWNSLTQEDQDAATATRTKWWLNEFERFSRVRPALVELFHTHMPQLPAAVLQAGASHDDDSGDTAAADGVSANASAAENLPDTLSCLPVLDLWCNEFDFLREEKFRGEEGRQALRRLFKTDYTPSVGEQLAAGDVYVLESWVGFPRGTTLVQLSHSGMQAATGEFLTYIEIRQTLLEERKRGSAASIDTLYRTSTFSDRDRQVQMSSSVHVMQQPISQPAVQNVQELLTVFYDEATGHTGVAADALAGRVQWSNTVVPFHATHRIPCIAVNSQSETTSTGSKHASQMDTITVSILPCGPCMSAMCYPIASGLAMDVVSSGMKANDEGYSSSSHSRTSCILKSTPCMVEGPGGHMQQLSGFKVNVLTGSAVSRVPASTVMLVAPDSPSGNAQIISVSVINEATRTVSDARLVRWFVMPEEEVAALEQQTKDEAALK